MSCAFFLSPLHTPAFAAEGPIQSYQSALTAYENGNIANAFIFAKLAGAGGDADAQTLVGHILQKGELGDPDYNQAVKWYLKAAMQDNTDAMVALGQMGLLSQGGLSVSDGRNWLEKAAKLGRTDAMRALSDMYHLGKGTPPDPAKRRSWLFKAANQGDMLAMRKLGDLDFEDSPKNALVWYEKAAQLGDPESAYFAGVMYAENFAIKPDAKKSADWLRLAALAGHPAAQADYGLMVYQGNGTERSVKDAVIWFKKSALGGDPEGRFLYAFTLAKGEGVKQSFEDAYYWLLRADEDSGATGIDAYDRDRAELKKRLEDNISPDVLARARKRAMSDKLLGNTPNP